MKITDKQIRDILDFIKTKTIISKHIEKQHWISGSSTIVYPICIYEGNKNCDCDITIQIDTKRDVFKKALEQIRKFDIVDYAYFNKTDNSCPAYIYIKMKGHINRRANNAKK